MTVAAIQDLLNYKLLELEKYSLTLGQLLAGLLVLVIAVYASKIIRHSIRRFSVLGANATVSQVYAVNRIIHYIILVIGFFMALSVIGIDMTKLALVAGALGVGVGLGLQNIVNNFVSGLTILLEKSIRVGDFIEFNDGVVGEVLAINIRATLVRTNDNVDILVPNAEIFSTRVINWTLEEAIRRFRVPFGVAYGSDKEKVKTAVLEAANAIPYTLKNEKYKPQVLMTGFGDSSLDFELAVWVQAEVVKRPAVILSTYLWEIENAFRKYEIEIPFPQRDLHFRSSPAALKIQGFEQESSTKS
ncbi:mechanosensitive ion channel [Porticoccaceae bacterium LTM1]|nr:mechanosensitive ion channel [Porticoccaceae bacterium LTM1]